MSVHLTRRQLLKLGLATGAGAFLSKSFLLNPPRAYAFYQSPAGLSLFAQPLRGVGPGGIPVALPDAAKAPVTGAVHYSIDIVQYTDKLHPNLRPTTLWGYSPAVALGEAGHPTRHLGGIIVVKKGTPIQITFTNKLPRQHILPVDSTIMGARGPRDNRTAVHLHGGLVPWISDGGPFDWFDSGTARGDSFLNNQVLNPAAGAGQAEYYYPNDQSARFEWYHDHAYGITRLNAYAGIASGYIIRGPLESALRNIGLPDFVENGGREIPIVVQDKIFVGDNIAEDSTWPASCPRSIGSLWYPHTYEGDRWELHGTPPDPSVIPEMFGDTLLANGLVAPFHKIAPALYRLRVLNACQARFLNFQLYVDDGSPDGITLGANGNPTNAKGPDFLVIGTEGGFLVKPVVIPSNRPMVLSDGTAVGGGSLITAPAERWDLLVDFSGFGGQKIILYNDAPAPFPGGDPRNDYIPTGKVGPNSRLIMRFEVEGTPIKTPKLITALENSKLASEATPFPVPPGVAVQNGSLKLPPGVKVRQLTLNETFDPYGRLIQFLGTNQLPTGAPAGAYGRGYTDPSTENVKAGSVEVWQIANLTGDTHPIHFHLVNVLVLARQPFNVDAYAGAPTYTGPARGPDPTELGWKETVKMNPDEVTTVIMKFDLAKVPFAVPSSPRTGGNEFVWHCHILEHEEHDMMRPLVVS